MSNNNDNDSVVAVNNRRWNQNKESRDVSFAMNWEHCAVWEQHLILNYGYELKRTKFDFKEKKTSCIHKISLLMQRDMKQPDSYHLPMYNMTNYVILKRDPHKQIWSSVPCKG